MTKVSIIVPYYQRTSGLLRRSLEAVFVQDVGPEVVVDVIVVDDQSPSPPEPEVDHLERANFAIRIVKRPNGGPGEARNTGLEAVEDADYVAFLDSDDWWDTRHLATALAALGDGAQFYFSDNIQDAGTTWFKELHCGSDMIAAGAPTGDHVYKISREALMPFLRTECVAHTSSVVIDARAIEGMRFDVEQARAGEDYLFWIGAASRAPYSAFCTAPFVTRGRGLDLYRSAYDWNNPECIRRLYNNLTVRKKIRARYCHTNAERDMQTRMINRIRRPIFYLMVRNAIRCVSANAWVAWRLLRHDAEFYFLLPYNTFVTARQLISKRVDFLTA